MPLSPRARRWSKVAAVVVVVALVLAWWVNRQLEPERLTRTVLDRAGRLSACKGGCRGPR